MSASPIDGADLLANWRPKAIVFDLLTALIDSWSFWDAACATATASPGAGRRWRERYLKITFGTGAYVPYEDLVHEAARDAGLPPSAPEALLRDWVDLRPWSEDAHVLRALRARGYALGVVTNCSKSLGHAAARGVESFASMGGGEGHSEGFAFDAVVTAEESGYYKPLRPAYEAILAALGVAPSEVLFVAGSAGDVQGATDAGMRVVWHNRIGLVGVGDAIALREGKTLGDTLADFL